MAIKQKTAKKGIKSTTKTIKRTSPNKIVRKTKEITKEPAAKTISRKSEKPTENITFITANVKKIQTAESWRRKKLRSRKVK